MATGIGVLLRPKAPLPSEQALLPKAASEQRPSKHSRRRVASSPAFHSFSHLGAVAFYRHKT